MNKILQNILFGVFIISLMSLIFSGYEKNLDQKILSYDSEIKSKINIANVSHYRQWNDYEKNLFSGTFEVRQSDINSSLLYKSKTKPTSYSQMCKYLSDFDISKLDLVYNTLDDIRKRRLLNSEEFVKVIVSFVQHITYELVPDDHRFDIYTPVEFMKIFKGDCDTKVLFLFTILTKFGYDVIMLNSDVHTHSVLGINMPSAGNYKTHLGKRYYTWETTTKGWPPGMLDASISRMESWYVALSN